MLAFCSVENYIHRLTASAAMTAFSQCVMVGANWPIFDGASWLNYFQWTKKIRNQVSIFIAICDYISYIVSH